ncbi:MAG: hypothetical protein U9N59_13505 [Campylobacterota bacterium]|nr:hypothetical protein [Campylobacterota bacterium]
MNIISFVVDRLPLHYYQAELLLYSIEKNTSYKKNDIIVQCLSRVDKEFFKFLEDHGYKYNIIEPYLDGKYCNKLQQLEYFKDKEIDGVILIDTDMFVIDDISDIKGDKIMAKIVDAPNPTLSTLKKIYTKASLELPKIVSSDWEMPNSDTLQNNFNGGFYYIPKKYINIISEDWKKWGEWLYNKKELFDNQKQFIHVDQISFSLAVYKNELQYSELSANYNFPIHSSVNIGSFKHDEEIKIIHYHREINNFGLVNSSKVTAQNVKDAVVKANIIILENNKLELFKYYKKSLTSNLDFSNKVNSFEVQLRELINQKKFNLILHAGTPKTGTTSLQHIFNNNYLLLKENKYLYPRVNLHSNPPKHQWIVSCLLNNNFDELLGYLTEIYQEAIDSDIKTIILSTEGIYNHWWDFSDEAKAVLQIISQFFDLKLWISFREPVSFLESFYRQNLKNPQIDLVNCYGKNLTFEEMFDDTWFCKHFDYLGFIYECEEVFGQQNIKIFKFSDKIIEDICSELKISIELNNVKKENIGQSSVAVDVLKTINKYNLDPQDKKKIVKQLSVLDEILYKYTKDDIIDNEMKNKIYLTSALDSNILKNDYNLSFKGLK